MTQSAAGRPQDPADREPILPSLDELRRFGARALDPGTATALPDRGDRNPAVVPRPTVYISTSLLVSQAAEARQVSAPGKPGSEEREDKPLVAWMDDLASARGLTLQLDREYDARRRRRGREALGPARYRIALSQADAGEAEANSDRPVPVAPVLTTPAPSAPDAWELLQRARLLLGNDAMRGVSLDHVLFGQIGLFSTHFHESNPFHESNAASGYDSPAGGRVPVSYTGPPPMRRENVAFAKAHGRRPVVGVLDTGCGEHSWLESAVIRNPKLGTDNVGYADEVPPPDPEQGGDWTGPLDGCLDPLSAHGTFIVGLIHQNCPDADILTWRVVKSEGPIVESDLVAALDDITELAELGAAGDDDGRLIDVLNLSMGYYHETPDDDALFDSHLLDLFARLGKAGCTVVCSAGNDGTARPQFPAAFASKVENCVSVGALNPNLDTVAIFSNTGDWVSCYAPGGVVLSTMPPFQGGLEPSGRTRAFGWVRESVDPDNFQRRVVSAKGEDLSPDGGFALWSGTSFAAPVQAGRIAHALVGRLPLERDPGAVEQTRRHAVEAAMPPGPPS